MRFSKTCRGQRKYRKQFISRESHAHLKTTTFKNHLPYTVKPKTPLQQNMHRQPPHLHHRGGGGVGGRGAPPPPQPQPQPQPQFPPSNFLQNPNFLPLQNPNLLNPFLQNPNLVNFPIQNPNLVNFPIQNPNLVNFPIRNPNLVNFQFPFHQQQLHQNQSSRPHNEAVQRADGAVAKARRELLAAGESVSAWKVSQAALMALKVNSWESLGFPMQQVPSLHSLIVIEEKVNAFIHCFVAVRRICSLYDIELELCKNEGVERFEELELGPLVRHPLVVLYFSLSSDATETFRITSEEIINHLHEFMDSLRGGEVNADEFLDYVAKKRSVTGKEKLNVRIQNLGRHITHLRQARKSENTVLNKYLKELKKDSGRKIKIRPLLSSQKKQMDDHFGVLTDRIKSFSSTNAAFSGNHIRFVSSSSEDEDDDDEEDDSDDDDPEDNQDENQVVNHFKVSSQNVKSSDRLSSCPYPSAIEEMTRLGLKSEANGSTYVTSGSIKDSSNSEASKRKRKFENINRAVSSPHNLVHQDEEEKGLSVGSDCLKKRARNADGPRESMKSEEQPKKGKKKKILSGDLVAKDLSVADDTMRLFITTWKEACQEHDIDEVFDRMLEFYKFKKKKKVKEFFSSYPFVGLLNVAVTSIKRGMWDSIYDSLLTFSQQETTLSENREACISIEVEQGGHRLPVSTDKTSSYKCGITIDDIIEKITAYLEANIDTISSPEEKRINFLRRLCKCESWLIKELAVEEFKSLGFGEFLTFLDRHMHLLSSVLHKCLMGDTGEKFSLEACMQQLQLDVLISQASNSLWENESISKQKIFELLRRQFPLICFKIVENDSTVENQHTISQGRTAYNCVLFSATLLKKPYAGGLAAQNENSTSENFEVGHKTGVFDTPTAKEAIEVLLGAPMLTDLELWSHWDLVFAPTLGPLVEWLLDEVNAKELLCLVTRGGKVIRIDHSATMDSFLEVLLRGSSFETAVQLLSLFTVYGGEQNVPKSLLKCHIQKAFEVSIKNSIEIEMNDDHNCLMEGTPLFRQHVFNEGAATNLTTELCRNGSPVNKVVPVVARFILDCLSYLPLEFCRFTADVFLAALESFVRDASSAILVECKQIEQRLILHEVGISLGVVEWINDYKNFCSLENANSLISSKSSNLITSSFELNTGSKFLCGASDKQPSESKTVVSMEADQDKNCKASDKIGVPEVSNQTYADNSGCHSFVLDKCSDPVGVIETIRREEFGLDPTLSDTESGMLKKQHARLGRALHCLSQELYSQDSHFLLELVQNADDNVYPEDVEPTLTFILQEKGIIILNNEQGFSAENIRALCDVGNSTKKGHSAGYIGKKGIGFKSVFRITNAPEIHSNGFHIKFDISEGQIGFVLPTVIPPCDVDWYSRLVSRNTYQVDQNRWNTCIVLPFSPNLSGGIAMNNIISMFSDLHPSLLLFLHRLKCITFRNMLSDTFVVMKKEAGADGLVKVFLGDERMNWLVVSQKLLPNVIRPDVQTTEISIAFTLQEVDEGEYVPQLNQQPVFAFLPLRTYGLKFIIQGDFDLPSSREGVDGDSPWNQWLLSEFPGLFVSSERSFFNLPCFRKCPGKAVGSFMSFVPLVGEVHGFFSSLPRMIISKLRMSNCLLLDGDKNEWVPPCKVIRNWTEQARALIPDSLLSEHLGLGFLNKDIVLSDSLAKALGVEEYGPKILLQIIRSLCHSENGLKSMGLGWLSAWLSAFYVMTLNTGIESDIVNSLRKLPFVPLSDGKHGSLDEGIIWLHSDALSFNNEYGSEAFPKLYSQLRTVSPALFSAAATVDISCFDTSITENVTRMLLRVGIQQLSAHDIMKAHILPAISDDRSKPGDEDLMTEYLAFSMFHLNSSCPNCGLERESIIAELRRKVFISTNHGHKRPVEVPIHFSKEFGNPININKLTNGMDMIWHEVNVTYLNHPLIKSVAGGVLKWRTFLQELGVTDFVQVVQVEKNIADVPQDVLKYLTWDQGLISIDSIAKDWESEELVYLLSQLSSRGDKEKCKYLLEILDMLWDDIFGNKVTGSCNITPTGESKLFKSSLISMFNEFQWMVSSMDDELHYPKDLFYDCIAVRSILGDIAPYAVPKVKSEKLLKDIGLKTEVALDDMLSVLKVWRKSETTFKASISQMSKFYNLIWSEMATSKEKVMEELQSGPFIFVPYAYGSSRGNVVPGAFLSPEEVYWHDSTGSMDYMKVIVTESAQVTTHHTSNKTLCHVYPTLHDFFVNECGVHEIPPCRSYLQVLLQLSAVALPSQAAKTVFQIFLRWADGLKSGSLASEDVEVLKENLMKKEYPVLPTAQDKWVSLNSSYGLVCWSDDENLRKEFKHQDNIDFLYFGELNNEEKEVLNTKFPVLMQRLGIRALSQVVTREAIYYGPADSTFKASLVNWALPYAQRYIYSVHPHEYSQLKQSGFETLKKLQIIVVEKLFYKNVIKKSEVASKKRYECNSLLQGNILYTTRESDSHTVFLELSHLFFDEPELHLANFLHMITTMVESGSSEEQAEFFILNSQKVPKIPDGEVVWSLSSLSLARANDEILVTNRVPPGTNEAEHLKPKRRPDMNSNWPPANWRTAPGFCFTRENGFKTQAANNQQIGNGDDVEENRTQTDSCNPIQIRVEGTLESDQVTSAPFVIVEDSKTTEIRSQFGTSEATSHMNVTFDSVDPVAAPDGSRSVLANFSEREQLSFGTPNMQQARLTGRMGEYVAYQYFVSRITDTFVRWVNEATETGLPYDLIVGDDERSLEYIEVKATKSARKDWFIISAREWQFAVEKGESFSIAYVVLSGDNMARVTVYKNPVKLCQLGKLQLAVVIPKQQ